jgi:hypothetical protein
MLAPQEIKVTGIVDSSKEDFSPRLTRRDTVDVVKHIVSGAK